MYYRFFSTSFWNFGFLHQSLPSATGDLQRTECLRSLRDITIPLAERPARGDLTGEICHWADGYHVNVRLYEKLLLSVFDVLDEGKLTEVSGILCALRYFLFFLENRLFWKFPNYVEICTTNYFLEFWQWPQSLFLVTWKLKWEYSSNFIFVEKASCSISCLWVMSAWR